MSNDWSKQMDNILSDIDNLIPLQYADPTIIGLTIYFQTILNIGSILWFFIMVIILPVSFSYVE